jgi:acetolactate synthase-1/2/3 large subunit
MRVSDYIASYLEKTGIKYVFGVTGGVVTPLIDSICERGKLEFICTAQEQGAAIAAEAYSRMTENIGVAVATSGPGATNLITGIGCAYFDSIPTLFLTGQVSTKDMTYEGGPRQIGFQETDIERMIKPITKFSKRIDDPKDIKYYLDKAIFIAKSGRPGPVLLDLPMDVQLSEMSNVNELRSYNPSKKEIDYDKLEVKVGEAINLISKAERPVLIIGAGVKIARAQKRIKGLIEKLDIPVVPSWGAMDVLPHNHSLFVEGFGVSHNRAGNFTVQNSDLIISLGSRLDTRQVGAKAETFAREAKKIVVDIDSVELYKKRGMVIDVDINYDLNDFLNVMEGEVNRIPKRDISSWKEKIKDWKERYLICPPKYFKQKDKVNPYVFMYVLSKESKEGDIVIGDTGDNLTWMMQGFEVKKDQKLFSAFGNSPMAYALPASVGASLALDKNPIICITGDGGFKMGAKELETIVNNNLPIKIFLMNNHEYGMIKQFQDRWFGSRYWASCNEGGLGNADLLKISEAYGVHTFQINNNTEILNKVREVFNYKGPVVCSVELKHGEKIIPKLEFGMIINKIKSNTFPPLK